MDLKNRTQNRELKFRVYIPDHKKLCYFDLVNFDYSDRYLSQHHHPVQQWTGLKDKNDKEIYEGDIVKYRRGFELKRESRELISHIKFQDAAFGFDMKGFNDMFMSLENDSDIEVVGNMYETPELVEDTK